MKYFLVCSGLILLAIGQLSAGESQLLPGMDTTVSPRVDFYHYANGTWLKNTEIPADKSSWGSFAELAQGNWQKIKSILEEAEAVNNPVPGSIEQKVGDFYASAMNTTAIEQAGLHPLDPYLQQIQRISSKADLLQEIVRLEENYIDPLFDFSVEVDEKNSDRMTFYLTQGGLGLPSKEYYFSELFGKIRAAYLQHVERMFLLLGDGPEQAKGEAATVWRVELSLAKASRARVDLRDAEKNYNPLTIETLNQQAPHFPWGDYFQLLGLGTNPKGVLGQPEFFKAVDQLWVGTSLEDWKVYLRWNLIDGTAKYLGSALEQEHFNFYGQELSGVKEMEPRWQRVARQVDVSLGEAMGQLYVAKNFSPEAKRRASVMIGRILAVFHDRLAEVDWMSPETRVKALKKFAALRVKIGYPEKWIDYSALSIDRSSYLANVLRANAFDFHRNFAKLGKPVDRTEWHMTPSTVNAYNNPTGNEIVFPAGILQPPFFGPQADDALNFGGIGAVIAHEITHGYDDQGRKYDAHGNLREWWTLWDAAQFKERSQKLVTQFSSYEALPGVKVNGELCLGEDIADLGGVSISLEALQRSLKGQVKPPLIEGFTPEQRFFLAWARVWRVKYREEALRRQVTVDVHAPGQFRAFGAPANVGAFYQAFGIKEGDPMWVSPPLRAKIW